MKKTIILGTGANGQTVILESVMRGALSFGFVVSKYTRLFNSRKEAEETIKGHPCRKGCRLMTLNAHQVAIIETLKTQPTKGVKLCEFLRIK